MFDILEAILYHDSMDLLGKTPLEPPYSPMEARVAAALQALDPEDAARLGRDLRVLVQERHDEAFQTGVRFGAQLMLALTEGF